MQIKDLTTYRILEDIELKDINSRGYILEHVKSGARISIISNDDINKVFYIGFKTPPKDETGVPHIIEHTVLCGSKKFPVKDPFVELVKGSLNTFLNAMTYPEKTVYPIASCNDKDFQNLMDVYLDAVFNPNIYKYKEIFKQEGWHYELEDKDSPLKINGVVYNEMKGAYSSAEEILQEEISKALFPDNAYGKDSGGNPEHIPELTYDAYLDFHRKYYHPVNSYIYLYGNMDIVEKLEWLDKEYLNKYDKIEVDSEIKKQPEFNTIKDVVKEYSIASDEDTKDKAYLSYSKIIEDVLDTKLYHAFDVLDYCLISAPGAPVKKALIDAKIGKDISSSYDDGILQPTFTICAKNANVEDKDRFIQVIDDTLRRVVKEGINKESILASINSSEFRFREADFGQYPKGLLYGLQILDSWLYDDTKPFLHLECLDTYKFLKEQIGTGYFENLIEKYLLSKKNGAVVTLKPVAGLNSKLEKEQEEKLAKIKSQMTEQEIEDLVKETKHLKEYQEEPSPKEELEKIPMLKRSDISPDALPFKNEKVMLDDVPVIYHDYETNGIDYIDFMFETTDYTSEELQSLALLKTLLSYVDTDKYKYSDLSNQISIYTGGINFSVSSITKLKDNEPLIYLNVRIRALHENIDKGLDLLWNVLLNTDFSDKSRIKELIAQTASRLKNSLSSSGNVAAALRGLSYISKHGYYSDLLVGIEFYRFVSDIDKNFDEKIDSVIANIKKVLEKAIAVNRLTISYTGNKELFAETKDIISSYVKKCPKGTKPGKVLPIDLKQKNEAFMDASQIHYVARVGNFKKHGFEYTGLLRILKVILSYDYLWINVRVKGGAYGCSSSFQKTGEVMFTSYRDPNLSATNDIYEKIPEYVRNFDVNDRDMTKYVIGTFNALDAPLYPEASGIRSFIAYLVGETYERIQKERDVILNATQEDIRNLADMFEAVLKENNICVIGNEVTIKKEKELFKNIDTL
ncbi:insulinase family protein [Lachnobacterium bovis]|uniref:Peptidase M16C associated domain-containing protein n=1 Tax=Lachnobacterium bovis TaxID=140626 RepID=A0A1H9TMC7_9FIRM|nr:insulinase family protein [Lachnobacterium bovis]SER98271.1 hypothetical protein SAMN02910429_01691 [Lachnobacterium bovis]